MDIGTDSWVLSICHIIWPWDGFVEYSAAYSEMCCNTHCRSCHSCIVSAVDQVIRKAMALGFVDQACREESLLRSFDRIPNIQVHERQRLYPYWYHDVHGNWIQPHSWNANSILCMPVPRTWIWTCYRIDKVLLKML